MTIYEIQLYLLMIIFFGFIIGMFIMLASGLKNDTDINTPDEPENQQNKQGN